jgi:hypothetical protein
MLTRNKDEVHWTARKIILLGYDAIVIGSGMSLLQKQLS